MIKLVTIDLDGTLLGCDHQVSDKNIQTIKEYYEKGIQFAICTGRTLSEVYHIESIKNLLPYTEHIIYTNGASCIDKDKNLIFDISMHYNDVEYIHSSLDDMDMMFEVYADGGVTCNEESYKNYKSYISEDFYKMVEDTRNVVADILEYSKNAKNGINMLLLSFLDNIDMKKAYSVVKNMDYYITFVGEKAIEFNHKTVDKGNGITHLAKKLGVEKNQILTIGDSYNDLTMRKSAGTLVSMANAIDELKEISDYVTSANYEDGVSHALRKFL